MSAGLPVEIDPFRLAGQGARLQGTLPLAAMTRLMDSVLGPENGQVVVDLRFDTSENGVPSVTGQLQTIVQMRCQRCLEPMDVKLDVAPAMQLRSADEPASQKEQQETLLVQGPLRLRELVEDELLLALPMLPRHGMEQCSAAQYVAHSDASESAAQANHPFAQLGKWKPKT